MNREFPRTLLILGRVSNLPTVWSNCLAAWMLAQGALPSSRSLPLFLVLAAGVTALYLGGMYLNDAFDVAFDTAHRPERPIPAGKISRRAVALWGGAWMAGGVALLAPFSGGWAWALAGAIVLYNVIHKHTALGLPVMAACRALIYPLVGAALWTDAAWTSLPGRLWLAAACMALWVLVLSILARTNSRWSAPVPNLLAAIPLVDLLVVFPHSAAGALPFLAFTVLALFLRRSIPPT